MKKNFYFEFSNVSNITIQNDQISNTNFSIGFTTYTSYRSKRLHILQQRGLFIQIPLTTIIIIYIVNWYSRESEKLYFPDTSCLDDLVSYFLTLNRIKQRDEKTKN